VPVRAIVSLIRATERRWLTRHTFALIYFDIIILEDINYISISIYIIYKYKKHEKSPRFSTVIDFPDGEMILEGL
jgi:hypothetical protein